MLTKTDSSLVGGRCTRSGDSDFADSATQEPAKMKASMVGGWKKVAAGLRRVPCSRKEWFCW